MRRPNSEELLKAHKNSATLLESMLGNPTNEYNLESVAAGFLEISYCNSPHVSGETAKITIKDMLETADHIWDLIQGPLTNQNIGYYSNAPMYKLMEELYEYAKSGKLAGFGKYSIADHITEEQEKDHNDKVERAYVATSLYVRAITNASQTSRAMNRFNKKNNRNEENSWELLPDSTMFQIFKYYNELDKTIDLGLRKTSLPLFLECMMAFHHDTICDAPENADKREPLFSENYVKTKAFASALREK